jgi:predicted RNA-binding protein YlxR (DUF448 family)
VTHTPIRTCTGCGRKAPQSELVPFRAQDGELVPGRGAGRSAYTCRRLTCFERAASRRAFNRTLKRTVRVDPGLARLYTEQPDGELERTEQTEPAA